MEQTFFFVYYLMDPRINLPFYVGKGSGSRDTDHLKGLTKGENLFRDHVIDKIRESGLEPYATRIRENLSESDAYALEESEISRLGRRRFDEGGILTNLCLTAKPPSAKGRPPGPRTMERMRTNNPHRKGEESHRLGLKHTDATRQEMSENQRKIWAAIPKEERAARNKKAWETRRLRGRP